MGRKTEVTLGSRIAVAGEGLGLFRGMTAVAAITELTTTVALESIDTGIEVNYGPPFDAFAPSLDSVGAIARTYRRKHEKIDNVRVSVSSRIPVGQGLASSGVLFCALAKCFNHHFGLGHSLEELVNIAWEAERIDQGIVCGKFDQYAILYKGALLQDFAQEPTRIDRFTLPPDTRVVIGCTGVSTPYGEVGSSIRDRFDVGDSSVLEYRENMRGSVEAFVRASQAGNKRLMGEWISFFHTAIRTQLRINNPHIDEMVRAALASGAYASKTCGIRFDGGSMFALCTDDTVPAVVEALQKQGATTHIVSIAYP